MRGILVLGIAVILAGCVSTGAESPGSTGSPATSPPPTATPSPAVSPTSPPSPASSPPGSVELAFEQVATVESTELYAAAVLDGGFVVGGCRLRSPSSETDYGGCAEAVISFSSDGRTWTDAVVPDPVGMGVRAFATTPLGLLAFGFKHVDQPPSARAIWRSTDGSRWEPFAMPAPPSIVFSHAFVLGGRTVLIGEDTRYDLSVETEAWATTDGRTWTRGETPMFSKVAAEPGIVAVGDGCVDLCPADLPTRVSRSADGLTWLEDEASAELAAGEMWSLGAWAGRAVLGGRLGTDRSSAEAAVWFDEPARWRVSRLPEGTGFVVDRLIDAGDRLIALGATEDSRLGPAWWTTDGRRWERAVAGGLAPEAYITATAGSDPLLLVIDGRSVWLSVD